ncbi:hypothetical protein ACLOJK_005803 [Asimina triloba]
MCYMSGSIHMENIYVPENEGGIWQWLFGRRMTSIALLNQGPHDGFVGIAAPSLARILPPDAFLCSVNDVTVTNTVDQRMRNGVASGDGILRQKLVGRGLAFLVAGGSVVQKNLEVGEVLVVDASCIVAMTSAIDLQVKLAGPMRRVVFGGDNLLTAVLTGPGIVFVQSLPFHRFSQRVASLAEVVLYPAGVSVNGALGTNHRFGHQLKSRGCHITKHEGKSKILHSDCDILFSSNSQTQVLASQLQAVSFARSRGENQATPSIS